MNLTPLGLAPEECFAFFEVDELGPDPRPLLRHVHPDLVVARALNSPAGYAWFELGARCVTTFEQSRVVGLALKNLQKAARRGELIEFRIVQGAHLLESAGGRYESLDLPSQALGRNPV